MPADATGKRAVTRYTYTTFSYGPIALPVGLSATGITLLTAKDTCLSSSVAAGTIDFTYVCPLPNRRRETYSYSTSASGAPLSPELIAVTPDSDRSSAANSMTYDNMGNVVSHTDLNGNTSYTTYDLVRRKVFEIGPDPDGSGPLPRPIQHYVYDANGNVVLKEVGTGFQINGSDFQVVEFERTTFDANDRPVRTEVVTP
jgi:YD repeat-containing protein